MGELNTRYPCDYHAHCALCDEAKPLIPPDMKGSAEDVCDLAVRHILNAHKGQKGVPDQIWQRYNQPQPTSVGTLLVTLPNGQHGFYLVPTRQSDEITVGDFSYEVLCTSEGWVVRKSELFGEKEATFADYIDSNPYESEDDARRERDRLIKLAAAKGTSG